LIKTFIKLCAVTGLFAIGGCGSDRIDLSCDKPALYQQAVEGQNIKVPADLDNLDPTRAMPIPDAAPPKPRAAGEPCLDIPPRYLEEEKADEPTDSADET
jgi:hypothetical protein